MTNDIEILTAILEEWENGADINTDSYQFRNALAMYRLKVHDVEWPPE